MTEFALIAPVFMLLIVGVLIFGRLFFYWIETNHLANETARWAAVDRNPYAPAGLTLQQRARSSATDEFENRAKVCIDFPGKTYATVAPGDQLRVRVQVPVAFAGFLGITIKGSSTMRLERLVGADPVANPGQDIGPCT